MRCVNTLKTEAFDFTLQPCLCDLLLFKFVLSPNKGEEQGSSANGLRLSTCTRIYTEMGSFFKFSDYQTCENGILPVFAS